MKKEHVVGIAVILLVWQIAAFVVANDILIPYPMDTFVKMANLFVRTDFYYAVGATLLRVLRGFLLSLAAALIASILCDRFEAFRRFFTPFLQIIKTVPNISYIVIALIWLGAEGAVSAVSFMILFPVFCNGFVNCLQNEDPLFKDVVKLYPESFLFHLRLKVIPSLFPELLSTGKTAAGLGLKVGIMAEILGQVRIGVGRSMNYARLNLDTSAIIAWTIVIILLSTACDHVFDWLQTQQTKKEE